MNAQPNICLFCRSAGPFTRVEHPIPESLGNDDAVLSPGFVCDTCNQYFGTKVEQVVLNSPPFSVERVGAAIRTKKGKYAKFISPEVSLRSTGCWDRVIVHGSDEWYKRTFVKPGGGILWVDRPVGHRSILCRFLLKVGLELLVLADSENPYDGHYDPARKCARFGRGQQDWHVGYAQYPHRSDLLIATREDEFGPLQTRQIYQYEIGAMPNGDRVLCFIFITHCFACNLSQPYLEEYVDGFNRINDFRMMLML